MTERRRRGARWSSNCFQTSSAFGFLAFIVRSRVGIRGVTQVHKQKKGPRLNTENTGAGARKSQRKSRDARRSGRAPTRICDDQERRCREKWAQKEKGQNRVKPQFYPRVSIPQPKR